VPYLSASEVVFDEEALYQLYVTLPLIVMWSTGIRRLMRGKRLPKVTRSL